MKYYSNDNKSHRNWEEERERTSAPEFYNSEVTVRKITPDELAKFSAFKPETKEHLKRTIRK